MSMILDGRTVAAGRGRTILEVCRDEGVPLPTLCHLDGVSEAASCRLCLVEVAGLPRPVPACSTPAWDGMAVATDTESLRRHRRAVLEMIFAGGHHVCATCLAAGRCELRALAHRFGLDHLELRSERRARPLDASRAAFALDPDRCVLCSRCVRVCAEREGARTLSIVGRGARTRLVTDGRARWADSPTCTDCGKCVAACPTGALLEKAIAVQPPLPLTTRAPIFGAAAWAGAGARRPRVATVWLGGCSGCHMSLLDVDERFLELASAVELVHSPPLMDTKEYPEAVDLCLVEGAVSSEDHVAMLARVRERTRILVALGDCAVTGNVTAIRNSIGGADAVLRRAWPVPAAPQAGGGELPALLPCARPLHEVVPVDAFWPGCPPAAQLIWRALGELLAGKAGRLAELRFG